MGIFQSDLTIKTAIELGLEDMRENPWLLDDALSDAVENPYLRAKYGQKQIDAMKEWFANNPIDIYMRDRNDKDRFPCITITLGTSQEKDDMKSMADQSSESVQLLPNTINKPIPYVVKPFPLISYDQNTGLVEIDPTLKGIEGVGAGMILVNPDNGTGYKILDGNPEGFFIEPNMDLSSVVRLAVVPQYQFYTARREHSFFQETYFIKCHAHGDPQTLLWLWTLVSYSILRYREGMLESQGFTQSSISSSNMETDSAYTTPGGESVWVRTITLTGMVENSWIKSPRRIIESVALRQRLPGKYLGGIKILSNNEPNIDEDTAVWYAIDAADSADENE